MEIMIEKYRPKTFDEIVGQDDIKTKIKWMIDNNKISHLLFCGEAGLGKTTFAGVIANYMLKDTVQYNFRELNASNERGIEALRKTIIPFVKAKPVNSEFKIILLDEADAITPEAQNALRRVMEQYKDTMFILSVNYVHKLINPLKSRCVIFHFKRYTKEEIEKIIKNILTRENMTLDDNKIKMIIESCNGDARAAINMIFGNIENNKQIYNFKEIPQDILLLVRYTKAITQKGMHTQFLTNLFDWLENNKLLNADVIKVFAEIDDRLSMSSFPEIQLMFLMIELRKLGIKI